MATKCRYCGNLGYGFGCLHSPTKKHEHIEDEKNVSFVAALAMEVVVSIALRTNIVMVMEPINVFGVALHQMVQVARIAQQKNTKNKTFIWRNTNGC